jgi:hypothetical protein
MLRPLIGEKCKWSTKKRKDGSITYVSQVFLVVFCSIVMVFGVSGFLLTYSPVNLMIYAQEESFLEICDNFADDDGDGFADADDPEGCSPNEGGETVPDQSTPPQDIITYPDGSTCDPNTQSCPLPEDTSDGTLPAEQVPECDPTVDPNCPTAEQVPECDPNTQSCPPPAEDLTGTVMGTQVSVWINAFIPRDIPGLTEPVPAGPFGGQTMIHGPVPGISDCYLTDNRGFDANEAASSRMHSIINIDITGSTPTEISQVHRISPTHEVDCEDGDVEGTGTASNTRMQFTNLQSPSPGIINVDVKGAANNPLATGSPDIDYQGTFTIDTSARTISFQGLIDSFPAFEAYVSTNGDPIGKAIFTAPPPPGNTPRDLFGDASTSVSGTATFP